MAVCSECCETVWTCTASLACRHCTVPARALVLLWHIACAVSLVDTGHTKSGLAACLLRVPGRGSVGRVLHWFFLSLKQKLRYVPDYSGEQATQEVGKDASWLLSQE